MGGKMILRVWDVEHGACAMLLSTATNRLAMIDSGHNDSDDWRPSTHIKNGLGRQVLDYLFITNADQDHMSDLDGLWQERIAVTTLFRNKKVSPEQIQTIKKKQGELTNDAERYVSIHRSYNVPASEPFNEYMGGIIVKTFSHSYTDFQDTNNLSLVVFVQFGTFKMLFPGDLEKEGWLEMLKNPDFVRELRGVTVLNAAHHGRENGYCSEIFNYFRPDIVVMSDKSIVHSTQNTTQQYYDAAQRGAVNLTTGEQRWVLTTRNDGWIEFEVDETGRYTVCTENGA